MPFSYIDTFLSLYMANPNSNMPPADQFPPHASSNPSIQVPDPPPSILLQIPQDDQSPHSTSSNPSPRPIPSPVGSSDQPFTSRHDQHSPRPIGFSSQPARRRQDDQSPRSVRSPGGSSAQPTRGRHPTYKGIRLRSGKWVSEIREPRKTTRIWLGTYPTPEMAATAYDVAALALKGPDTPLNFPESILSYPIPASPSSSDIRAAAASAASARSPKPETGSNPEGGRPETEGASASTADTQSGQEFVDEEELLNLPHLLVDMAEGMLVSPPRINTPSSDDSPGNSDAESLWSYQ